MCRQVLENISERKENYLGSLMNRATCEQTAPGSKVSFCIKWVLLLWRSRCPHSFKRQTPRRNTLFHYSYLRPHLESQSGGLTPAFTLCSSHSVQNSAWKSHCSAAANAGLHSSAVTAVPQPSGTTHCYCSSEGKTALSGCLSTEENISDTENDHGLSHSRIYLILLKESLKWFHSKWVEVSKSQAKKQLTSTPRALVSHTFSSLPNQQKVNEY